MTTSHQKILKALKFYTPDSDENSEETLNILRKNNLIFQTVRLTHDDCLNWLNREFKAASKHNIIDDFLFGLQNSLPQFRAAFSAYAIMQNFPSHLYTGLDVYCDICGGFKSQKLDLTFVNATRYTYGSLRTLTPAHLAFYIEQHNNLPHHPLPECKFFIDIITEILNSPSNETPTTLTNRLSAMKTLRLKKDETRGLLETLGYAGILQTPQNKGYIYEFTPPFSHPSKSHHSDWRYPVDFWTGKDGVNKHAISYWFSEHPQILATCDISQT